MSVLLALNIIGLFVSTTCPLFNTNNIIFGGNLALHNITTELTRSLVPNMNLFIHSNTILLAHNNKQDALHAKSSWTT